MALPVASRFVGKLVMRDDRKTSVGVAHAGAHVAYELSPDADERASMWHTPFDAFGHQLSSMVVP